MSIRELAHYDRAYFDKWYRNPRHRVKSPLDIRRQLSFIVSATEYIFERPLRSVLDVGSGEGNWGLVLRKLRPEVRYYGVDPSVYAVKRFGKRRNIQLGGLGDVGKLDLPDDFDLILCCGVLNYVGTPELTTGLVALRDRCAGTAYFEIFAREDDATGDFSRSAARPAAFWRKLLRNAGWQPLGMHLYVRSDMSAVVSSLELGTQVPAVETRSG
ncbi:MAG: class I SAM-dependent DNA methyltransferase [Gemmatimonadota bacterium]